MSSPGRKSPCSTASGATCSSVSSSATLSTTQTETSQTQTVEFLDVGTQLSVRPFVSDDDYIRLELQPSVSDGSTSQVNGFIIPNLTTQKLTTNVLVHSGQTIVLGGLFKEDTQIARRQIPGFGDIPIVGNIGKGRSDQVQRDEVIFLIKTTVLQDAGLARLGESAEQQIDMAQVGIRRGLLPWSNTSLTSAHMKKAQKAIEAGDRDKALWNVNVALHIDPTLSQALAMRSQLTGERIMTCSTTPPSTTRSAP